MPEIPAPTTRTSRCSRSVTTGILPASAGRLPDRAAAAEDFAFHLCAVGELEVAPGEEPPGRAGGEEQVLLLPLVGPVPLDLQFREGQRALAGDDRRDRDLGLGPINAAGLGDHRRRDEG